MAKKIKKMTEKQKAAQAKKMKRALRKRARQAKRSLKRGAKIIENIAKMLPGYKESRMTKALKKMGSVIQKRIWHKAQGVDEARLRLAELKEFNVNNQGVKRFKAFRKTFKEKHGKDLFSPRLNPMERKEAESIIQMFLNDPDTDINQIELTWENYADKNLLGYDEKELEESEDYISLEQKAKDVDVVKNRVESDRIANVMGSIVVNNVWNTVKMDPDQYDVSVMSMAISNITDILEDHDPGDRSTEAYRAKMVIEEYERLMGETK